MSVTSSNKDNHLTGLEIAVIGMAGKFPNAVDTRSFWENLKNGIEGIAFFSKDELIEEGYSTGLLENASYVRAKGVMEGIEYFDAAFFDYSSREAELMDPQMRIFHELCWEALEDAGYAPTVFKGLVGLYAGAAHNHPWIGLSVFSGKTRDLGQWAADQLVDKGYLTMRVSYKLNLRGPSYTMYTACSTSLAAVHLGCQAILNGECDMALTGGITIILPYKIGYLYQEGMIMSPDGHCRAFDAAAGGTVVGNGAGIVLLRRLEDSLANNDHIYAVIKGSALNNDGFRKSGFTAPSVEGQVEAIRTAQQMAGVKPESIGYIETHGTGTAIGDPIEVEALTIAFNTPRKNFCALGAVKSNIGHLDAAAGIAGFIKAVLTLMHRQIPPSMHYNRPNPQIDFANSPFYVNTQLREWKSETYPLRAGVSSFGIGGTNAHVIIEEPPGISESVGQWDSESVRKASKGTRGLAPLSHRQYHLILLSAKTKSALGRMTENLTEYLKKNYLNRGNHKNPVNPGPTLADIAYTLQVGREAFKYRKAFIATDIEEAIHLLSTSADPSSSSITRIQVGSARDINRLVFMFSGQGSQYVNMGRELYEQEPVFRQEMDRCFEILNSLLEYKIKDILYPDRGYRDGSPNPTGSVNSPLERGVPQGRGVSKPAIYNLHLSPDINQTKFAQPLIFASEYAMAKLLMQWGIKPYTMIGHSIGEYVAACLSGVFSLEDALKLVAARGKLMQQMPPGAMLSVTLAAVELEPLLGKYPGLALAAVNAPNLCVVSGPPGQVEAMASHLKTREVECRPLHTSHAFHSSMMDPILKPFAGVARKIVFNQPRIPYISNVTGQWISPGDAVNPAYWVNHLRKTVRFSAGITQLLPEANTIFIELGPGRSLETFVKKHIDKTNSSVKVMNLVRHTREETPDSYYLLNKLGQLWVYGEPIDGPGYYAGEKRRRLALPTYPFERKRYWLEVEATAAVGPGLPASKTLLEKRKEITDWFYTPSWKRSLPHRLEIDPNFNWLFLLDETGLGDRLQQRLRQLGAGSEDGTKGAVVSVRTGTTFTEIVDGAYTVNPQQPGDYQALIARLKKKNQLPNCVVHLWGTMTLSQPGEPEPWDETYQDRGYYSLINLAQAMGEEEVGIDTRILVVTNNMQEVSGGDLVYPQRATVLGAAAVISKEYPNLKCFCVDVVLPRTSGSDKPAWLDWLLAEGGPGQPGQEVGKMIAYRHPYRWEQTFSPLSLAPWAGPAGTIPRLKPKDVYLITGGTGGIGLVLAQYLAKKVKARLILTGRTLLPEKEEWGQTGIIRRKIQELESTGAEVWVVRADVSDEQRMREVIAAAEEKWGPIHGVIHASGIAGGGLIQMRTREQARLVMLPKVKGTLVLDNLLRDHPLEFFILCSSINSIIPFLGQSDYYAANAFLNAFAYYKSSRDGVFTVSIDWDTWQEVGMALKAAQQLTGKKPLAGEIHRLTHPLLDYRVHRDPQKEICVTHFNFNRHWVLNEHKAMDTGKGLVPGVTYLEMAREAFAEHTGHRWKAVEINEVYFLNPLMVGENEERETRLILEKQAEIGEYEFLVQSRANEKDDNWQKHAVGKITALEGEETVRHEIESIVAGCGKTEIVMSQTADKSQQGLLYFGPRWRNLHRVRFNEKKGVGFLRLGETFAPDLESYKLHPALLDSAAGFLSRYIYPGSAYIPFSYKRIRVRSPLPAAFFSYSRLIEDGGPPQKEVLKFDVTIMDEQGRELVEIKEFTMLEVTREVKSKITREAAGPTRIGETPADIANKSREFLKNGILSSEGVEVFARILSGSLPQVVVSTLDLMERIRSNQEAPSKFLVEEIEKSKPTGPMEARPEISTVYIAPRTDLERTIAGVWQEILGLDSVGIHDDFFELGGDSLNIVQLNGLLKKSLKREIPVAVLFRYLTIHSFARYLLQEEEGHQGPAPQEDRIQVLKESKSRLKERISRRTSSH